MIPMFRQYDITNLAASQKFIPKHASASRQTWQAAKQAENTCRHVVAHPSK